MNDFETLVVTLEDGVAHIEFNRADRANAFNRTMWHELGAVMRAVDAATGARVAVLSGRGRHFTAGIDLAFLAELQAELAPLGPGRRQEQLLRNIRELQDAVSAIENCRKPVLAAIHNTCIGGGVDMVCCADIRYGSADAFFSVKEIDLGMVADVGTLQRLPRLIDDGLLRELAYTGRRMDAREALQAGLLTRVYPDREALLAGVMEIARSIAARSPLAVRGTKEVILFGRDHSVEDGLRYIANWNAGMLSADDLTRSLVSGGKPEGIDYPD